MGLLSFSVWFFWWACCGPGFSVPGCSRTELEVGHTTSCEKRANSTTNPSMYFVSSVGHCWFCIRQDSGRITSLLYFGSSWCCFSWSRNRGFVHEAETRRRWRSRSAMINRRLVSLARSASAPIDFEGREHKRAELEQTFDNGMFQFKLGYFYYRSIAVPQLVNFVLDHHSRQCDASPACHTLPSHLCEREDTDCWSNK